MVSTEIETYRKIIHTFKLAFVDAKEIKDKKIAYKLANIKDYSKIEGNNTVYRIEGE
jgi:hypothetical protein